MKCNVCDKDFESKRNDSRYCGSQCRQKALRIRQSVTDNVTDKTSLPPNDTPSIPPVVPDIPFRVHLKDPSPPKETNGAFDRGYCHWGEQGKPCGKDAYFGDVCVEHYTQVIRKMNNV